jgi:hypothetical protein
LITAGRGYDGSIGFGHGDGGELRRLSWIDIESSGRRIDPGTKVCVDDVCGDAFLDYGATIEPDRAWTQASDGTEIMAHEYGRFACGAEFRHRAETLALEFCVTRGEDFVNNDNFRLEVGGNCEGETEPHSVGILLERCINKPLYSGKDRDLVNPVSDVPAGHAEKRAVQVDVLSARQFWMKPRADLEYGSDPASCARDTCGWLCDSGQDLEER